MARFKKIKPSSLFDNFIDHYWMMETTSAGDYNPGFLFPGNAAHIVFDLQRIAEGHDTFLAYLIGNRTHLIETEKTPDRHVLFGIQLHPWALKPFFPFADDSVQNNVSDLGHCHSVFLEFSEVIAVETPDPGRYAMLFETVFAKHIRSLKQVDSRIVAVFHEIRRSGVSGNIDEILQRCFQSRRTFQRLIDAYCIPSAKEIIRVERFGKVIEALQAQPDINLGEIAVRCGYYDHSHFSHDFLKIAGLSPSAFLSAGILADIYKE